MKAVLVDRTAAKATIRLVPSWLERLFGSREFLIELVWNSDPEDQRGWVVIGSQRLLENHPDRDMMTDALDRMPVADPARAVARERTTP